MTKGSGRIIKKVASLCVASVVLSGCAALDGNLFQESFWASGPFKQNDQAELGLAEMAKGNYVTAEGYFQRALKANWLPGNTHKNGRPRENVFQINKINEIMASRNRF